MVYRGVVWLVAAVSELHVTLGWLSTRVHPLLHYPTTALFGVDNHLLPLSPQKSFLAPNNKWLRLTSASILMKVFEPFAHILNLATLHKDITTMSSFSEVKLVISSHSFKTHKS